MNPTEVLDVLDRAVIDGDIPLRAGMEAWTAFQTYGVAIVEIKNWRVIILPESLKCDCGKGIWCPLNKQIPA